MQDQTLACWYRSLVLCFLAVWASASTQPGLQEEDLCSVLQWPTLVAAEEGLQKLARATGETQSQEHRLKEGLQKLARTTGETQSQEHRPGNDFWHGKMLPAGEHRKLSGTTSETQEHWAAEVFLHSKSLLADERRYIEQALSKHQQLLTLNAKLAQALATDQGAMLAPHQPHEHQLIEQALSEQQQLLTFNAKLAQALAPDQGAMVAPLLHQIPDAKLAQVLAADRGAMVAAFLPQRSGNLVQTTPQEKGRLMQVSRSTPSVPQKDGGQVQISSSMPSLHQRNVSLGQTSRSFPDEVVNLLWKLPEAWVLLSIGLAAVLATLGCVLGATPWGFVQRLRGLSWETRKSAMSALVIFGSVFYFMWCAGSLQPILNEILSYLVIALFLLTVIAIALLEIWRISKPTVMVPLAAMKRVHERLVHMEQMVGGLSKREAQQLKDGTHPELQNL